MTNYPDDSNNGPSFVVVCFLGDDLGDFDRQLLEVIDAVGLLSFEEFEHWFVIEDQLDILCELPPLPLCHLHITPCDLVNFIDL